MIRIRVESKKVFCLFRFFVKFCLFDTDPWIRMILRIKRIGILSTDFALLNCNTLSILKNKFWLKGNLRGILRFFRICILRLQSWFMVPKIARLLVVGPWTSGKSWIFSLWHEPAHKRSITSGYVFHLIWSHGSK